MKTQIAFVCCLSAGWLSSAGVVQVPARPERIPHYAIVELTMPPSYIYCQAYAINAGGQVAGYVSPDSLNRRACIWDNGKVNIIGTLGGKSSEALGINEAGDAVGYSY